MARQSTGRLPTTRTVSLPRVRGARLESPTLDWSTTPNQVDLPSIADLLSASIAERSAILKRFGITPPWQFLKTEAAAYVARMTQYPPGSPLFQQEVQKLTDWTTKTGSLGAARTAYRQFSLLDSMRGKDPKKTEYVRVGEGDEAMCGNCERLAGEEGTMEYHASIGLTGSSSCEGGSRCRCDYMEISDR